MNIPYKLNTAEAILVSDVSADTLFSVVYPLLPSSIPFQHHILMVEIDDGSDKCHKTNEAHDGEKCC